MEFVKVQSSNIKQVAFNEGLIVEFNSGAKYKYKGVTEETYKKLLEAESKGRFINSEIKNKYEFERIVE